MVTITPTTSTINGNPSILLSKGQSIGVVSDGTNYSATVGAGSTSPAGSNTQVQTNSSGSFGAESQSGTGGFVASAAASGTQVSGDVATWNNNHDVIDSGTALAGLGGGQQLLGVRADATAWWSLAPIAATVTTGTVYSGTGYTYCTPFSVPVKLTISAIGGLEQTVGTTTSHAYIYADAWDSTNHRHYPTSTPLVSDSNNPANTSASVSFTMSYQLSPSTMYWGCTQQGDTTAKWYTFSMVAGGLTVSPYTSMSGATTLALSVAGQGNGVSFSGGTFGTPPNTSAATSWTITTLLYAPLLSIQIASIP